MNPTITQLTAEIAAAKNELVNQPANLISAYVTNKALKAIFAEKRAIIVESLAAQTMNILKPLGNIPAARQLAISELAKEITNLAAVISISNDSEDFQAAAKLLAGPLDHLARLEAQLEAAEAAILRGRTELARTLAQLEAEAVAACRTSPAILAAQKQLEAALA